MAQYYRWWFFTVQDLIDVTPLPMIDDGWRHGEDNLLKKQHESMACTRPEPGLLEVVKNRSKAIIRMNCTTWRTHAEGTHRHIMWRFAGNDVRKSLNFKTDELSINEATARSAKWCISSVSGMIIDALIPRRLQKLGKTSWCGGARCYLHL